MKTCKACAESKPLADFTNDITGKQGVRGTCKKCEAKKRLQTYIKKTYHLSWEQYEEMTGQGCALCGSFDDLHVDHDHACCPERQSCGKCVRGVLCAKHNHALGLFNDDIDALFGAAAYLMETRNILKEVSND